jgi:hypothetical protein
MLQLLTLIEMYLTDRIQRATKRSRRFNDAAMPKCVIGLEVNNLARLESHRAAVRRMLTVEYERLGDAA